MLNELKRRRKRGKGEGGQGSLGLRGGGVWEREMPKSISAEGGLGPMDLIAEPALTL